MLFILWSIVAFLVAIGILVTFHEYGHYRVARWCGVHVEVFSIGFGKKIWSRVSRSGTQFSISAIPLGGYVKFLDGRVSELTSEQYSKAFDHKSIAQRAAIISAGPIANFILCIVLYWIVYMIGIPTLKPVIGQVTANSVAEQAHFPKHSEIIAISGVKTPDWQTVRLALVGQLGKDELTVDYKDSNKIKKSASVDIKNWRIDLEKEDPITAFGIQPELPQVLPIISLVQENSAAEKAGLLVNDKILQIEGNDYTSWDNVINIIQSNPEKTLRFTIERKGLKTDVYVKIGVKKEDDGKSIGVLGIMPKLPTLPIVQYNPVEAVWMATKQTGLLIKLTANSFVQLVTGVLDLKNISGPISIAKGAGTSASYGVVSYLTFLAFISVSLGIINLVPLPVLDGGHLLFLILEKIKGKSLSEKAQNWGFQIGAILLILLMGLALFNDFSRL